MASSPAGVIPRRHVAQHGLVEPALFGAMGLWVLVAAARSGDRPWPTIGLLLASAATLWVTRVVASFHREAVLAALLAVAAAVAIRPDIVERKPTAGPFGYVNATGAFFMLASFAAIMLATTSARRGARAAAGVCAVACAAVPFAVGSMASAALVVAMPLLALTLPKVLPARSVIAVMAGVAAAALLVTVILGATFEQGSTQGGLAETTLSVRRLSLWHDALVLMADHPITGVGPGRFARESATARSDRDTRRTHNAFLQQGAETGIPGMLLLLSIFGWAFVSLARMPAERVACLAAAGVAALAVAASVDYVLSIPAVPLAAAALVGTATRNVPGA